MTTPPREATFRHLFIACSVALFVTGGSIGAFAHGGGSHHDGGNHNSIGRLGSNDFGGRNVDGGYWGHHHHHPGNGPGGVNIPRQSRGL